MTKARVTHRRDIRLFVNAGISIPACLARRGVLNMDASRLKIAKPGEPITCKNCRRIGDDTP